MLPSLEGDEGADKPEPTRILAFFGGAWTVLSNEGGKWMGWGAQPLVKGGAIHASSELGAENML